MPPPETIKSEIGSQSKMCQVHTGAYVCLTTRAWNYRLYRLPPQKHYHVHIARVPISTHTQDRRKSSGKTETKKTN